jgi:hypothetical protein
MIRLLDPSSPEDINLFRAALDEVAKHEHPVYYREGLIKGFEYYVKLFSTIESNPAKQMYVSAEIINGQIVRMVATCTMEKLWTLTDNSKGPSHYFALLFWYTAPGYTKTNYLDNEAGRLAFDKFIDQGMHSYLAVMQGPKTARGLKYYNEKMFKGAQRIYVFIDKYIDSQEKLEELRNTHTGFRPLLPLYYKNPVVMYTGVIKPEFRNYDNI